ncbi:MAG: acyl transferase [Bacteroidota bacterium]|nr:acyl transferase [Bacteroidota bacterium]
MQPPLVNNIFSINDEKFLQQATEIFQFQYQHNAVYKNWCDLTSTVNRQLLTDFPFLPISFFKSHQITTTLFQPQQIFESSGTTQTINSRHLVKDINLYKQSFSKAFELFYGDIKDWCVIGLLPSYLERNNSSLVMMVDELIKMSGHADSDFYLYDFDKLQSTLQRLEMQQQKTLLIGVTFALLDFADTHPMQLNHTTIMETGGMKGRRKELTRFEIHDHLKQKFAVKNIHSEYGMTELLSQAYSKGDGIFVCPPWMKVLVRDEEDPLRVSVSGRGVLNVIDLANIYSCIFIATDDVGMVYEDGSFEVFGRLDNSDIRGCSLLVV